MKNIRRKAIHQLSFIFLPLLALSFGMVGCGSDSDSDGRRGSRGAVSGQPALLSFDQCHELNINGDGSLEFDFSSAQGSNNNFGAILTYVSDGYNDEGSERIETNDDGVEVTYYDDQQSNIFSGYVYIPREVMSIILNNLNLSTNEDTLCVHGLDFATNGVFLAVEDTFNFNRIKYIDLGVQ